VTLVITDVHMRALQIILSFCMVPIRLH